MSIFAQLAIQVQLVLELMGESLASVNLHMSSTIGNSYNTSMRFVSDL